MKKKSGRGSGKGALKKGKGRLAFVTIRFGLQRTRKRKLELGGDSARPERVGRKVGKKKKKKAGGPEKGGFVNRGKGRGRDFVVWPTGGRIRESGEQNAY